MELTVKTRESIEIQGNFECKKMKQDEILQIARKTKIAPK